MQKEKLITFCKFHGIVLLIFLFLIFVYKCPFYLFFNIPCLGCGITRAYLAALHFDFKVAFEYHPLFFIVAPMIFYIAHRNKFKKHLSYTNETSLMFIIVVLFIVVYTLR